MGYKMGASVKNGLKFIVVLPKMTENIISTKNIGRYKSVKSIRSLGPFYAELIPKNYLLGWPHGNKSAGVSFLVKLWAS